MNTNENENTRNDTQEDVVELGVASTDTKGPGVLGEMNGGELPAGISAE
ncbi:benenodin family lasso peptide [Dyella sp.]|nr:benenodin family lasso peptide [Dyella sp.]HET7331363.1 benenodin family lasso peptide [Dyella sp.]